MTFLLTELLKGSRDVSGIEGIAVSGVNANSSAITKGDAFFALPGTKTHGDKFAAEAAAKGAVVMVTDREPAETPAIPVVIVEDVRSAYAKAAAHVYAPQPEFCVGVTGTSGKTSVTTFVRQLWQASGIPAAAIGTLGFDINGTLTSGALTTPDPLTLHKSLGAIKAGGINHVAMEASSHGLDQRRLDGVSFKAVGFTNLGRDHLDYHADEEAYREAKLRLFRDLLADEGVAVVNTDDPEHMPFMFAALDRGATLLTVGIEGAFFEVSSVEREGWAQRVVGRMVGEPVEFLLPLVGRFQVDNAVMAAALAIQTGADAETTIEALNALKGPKGRMEMVGQKADTAVFVDYSHKPEALEAALSTLRPYAKGRLIVVFGCGGDRDKGKRPIMGEIANRLADKVIITDDNPRHEDAQTIRSEILAAATDAQEIADRGRAIRTAIAEMQAGDVLLIAGKGHEEYQIIGDQQFHFSDQEVAAAALSA